MIHRFALLAITRSVMAVILCVMLMGCQGDSDPSAGLTPMPTVLQGDDALQFSLNRGDILRVNVFGDDSLSKDYEIDRRGMITLPLIGDITAAGNSTSAVKNTIITRLSDGFLHHPKVSIEVISVSPFYILGEVKNPGAYPVSAQFNMFKAIATAGGLTHRARKERFVIYRGYGKDRVSITANRATPVLPGDSILVEERLF